MPVGPIPEVDWALPLKVPCFDLMLLSPTALIDKLYLEKSRHRTGR